MGFRPCHISACGFVCCPKKGVNSEIKCALYVLIFRIVNKMHSLGFPLSQSKLSGRHAGPFSFQFGPKRTTGKGCWWNAVRAFNYRSKQIYVVYPSGCIYRGRGFDLWSACQPFGQSWLSESSICECTPCCDDNCLINLDALQGVQNAFTQNALSNCISLLARRSRFGSLHHCYRNMTALRPVGYQWKRGLSWVGSFYSAFKDFLWSKIILLRKFRKWNGCQAVLKGID